MTAEPEWGPWIDHDGSCCPCIGSYVHVIYYGLNEEYGIAFGGGSWKYGDVSDCDTWCDGCEPIIHYRIRKPRAMSLLQQIVENPPKELIREKEDA